MARALAILLVVACIGGAAALRVVPNSMSWKSCGTSADHCPVSNVIMSPDPGIIGKEITFNVTCKSDETVTGGTSTNQAYIDGIQVLQHTFQLCSLQGEGCPAPPGVHTTSGGMPVPAITPPGTVQLKITNVDQNKAALNCIMATFEVTH
mmetsp:Transcript_7949/g.28333  ORF Transcript_7949/g.28333 Transcript_7949/m.28333 type:complete len:150 (-) Transcript_7949:133-582(-)|eukprot:CAMPEP_0203807020 /NCGR_PEP_ID=MMETSP0115-20131106/829_1 /ASSEMBLY_ACC=CAM_ASM_000227 /TAXON_ID=33651 /ORGANISM="Bicosoecid sp, Strain ms1" /LENGTH=149 /DNA_ID=CAMNT_0050715687 /DNA_START=49 /DNA_END=498 /DNA_ORIENTATION=+